MATRELEKNQWQHYFDRISRNLPASNVDLEVSGLDLGAQVEAQHLPLEGLSYDSKDDAFSIRCEGLEHRVYRPASISVREDDAGALKAVEIVDEDGRQHIARLTGALQLPGDGGRVGR